MINYALNITQNITPASFIHWMAETVSNIKITILALLGPKSFTRCDADSIERQFNEIINTYDNLIVKLCFGYARTHEELEDLHQDTLINIWQGLQTYNGDASLSTWIYRVTLNTCVSTLRKRKKELPSGGDATLYEVIDDSEERRIMIRELHEIIAQLSPVDKSITLLWLDEFSYDEIADMMGMKRNTVGTRLKRAREKLKSIR